MGALIKLGAKLMKSAGIHHHFFGECHPWFGYSLTATAKALAYFALGSGGVTEPIAETRTLSEQEALAIIKLYERRISERFPVAYITHEAEYMGRSFYVNEHVLVPRSIMSWRFQEILEETDWENRRVLDLCTGSGCIGITLALMDPRLQVDLADISEKALEVAEVNVRKHGVESRVKCIQSDCFASISGKYDLIITNPPYVRSREYKQSPPEFLNEPKLALESGRDGLDVVNRIIKGAALHLNPRGKLVAEVGSSSARELKKQYRKVQFEWFKYRAPWQKRDSLFLDDMAFVCRRSELEKLA